MTSGGSPYSTFSFHWALHPKKKIYDLAKLLKISKMTDKKPIDSGSMPQNLISKPISLTRANSVKIAANWHNEID